MKPRLPASLVYVAAMALSACEDPATAPPAGAPTGTLHVHVSTLGSAIDEDGYWFRARDTADFVAPNADFTIPGMASGPIEVELGGLAHNCGYVTDSLLNLEIHPAATALAEFAVTCEPTNVTLVAVLRLAGPEPDPDGFTVWLEGEDTGRRLRFNRDDVGFSLRPGTYTMELRDIRSNCTIRGSNPRRFFLPQKPSLSFEVFEAECVEAPGAVEVSVTTTGRNPDPDGFDVALDGMREASVSANGEVLLEGVPSDSVSIGLGDVSANCTVLGGSERTARIPAVDTLSVRFEVVCGAGSAVQYVGSERAVLAGAPPELDAEWTIEFWTNVAAGSDFVPILHQEDVVSFFVWSSPPESVGQIGYLISYDGGESLGPACDTVRLGSWNHFAATYNRGLLRFYLNGTLCLSLNRGTVTNAAPGNPLMLGGSPFETDPDALRSVDALRIWREARTADELLATRDGIVDPTLPTLLGDWRFDSGTGQIAVDETGRLADFVFGTESGVDADDPSWIAPGRP